MNWGEYFTYNAETGDLIWKPRPLSHFKTLRAANLTNTSRAGKVVDSRHKSGYLYPGISGRKHLAHRIIWEMVNGSIPTGMMIDHINGVKDDNRLLNLRLATHQQNKMNGGCYSTSKSNVRGVQFCKSSGLFRARIMVDGKYIHLGRFKEMDAAAAAYQDAARKHFGNFAK